MEQRCLVVYTGGLRHRTNSLTGRYTLWFPGHVGIKGLELRLSVQEALQRLSEPFTIHTLLKQVLHEGVTSTIVLYQYYTSGCYSNILV